MGPTETTLHTEQEPGQLLYLRVSDKPENPGEILSEKTVFLPRGATMDVLARRESNMGVDRVRFSMGLLASRKIQGEVITYRFKVPDNAPRGARYSVHCAGQQLGDAFSFSVQVK